jgi:GT2 family glycosyltransferase
VTMAGVPTYVVVPVRDRLELTRALVGDLVCQGGHDGLFVFDNGSTDGTACWLAREHARGTLVAVDAAGWTLHRMWNAGIRLARERDPACNIAILNNDLRLGPDFCRRLAAALRSEPDLVAVSPNYDGRPIDGVVHVTSTFKNGGLAGFAYMVRGEAFDHIAIDETLRWWYGDDDLVAQIAACGGRVGVTGATTVEHVNGGSQTITYTREVVYDLEHDLLHMLAKWGHS